MLLSRLGRHEEVLHIYVKQVIVVQLYKCASNSDGGDGDGDGVPDASYGKRTVCSTFSAFSVYSM